MATPHTQPAPLAPQYLQAADRLVVMSEDHEVAIDDVRGALEALSWLGNELANADLRCRRAAANGITLTLPPDGFSALMRVLCSRLEGVSDNPSLGKVLRERADLCDEERSLK